MEGASRTQGQILPGKPDSKAHRGFDRMPRHRIREDRYEYKGADNSKTQSASQNGKTKRRRSRKHTMNDVFHAANVARERLTLRGNQNVGIFKKGKASSPLKLHDAQDLAFSETLFLTKRRRDSPTNSPPRDKKRKMAHKPVKNGKNRQQKRPEYMFSDLPKEQDLEGDNTEQPVSRADESCPPNEGIEIHRTCSLGRSQAVNFQKGQTDLRRPDSSLKNPIERVANDSQSATPYTWSITSRGKSQREHALEAELLKVLLVGLYPVDGAAQCTNSKQDVPRYYNIDELRSLLESRKMHWTSENNSPRQNMALSPAISFHQDRIIRPNKIHENMSSGYIFDPNLKYVQSSHTGERESIQKGNILEREPTKPASRPQCEMINLMSQPNRLERPCDKIYGIQETLERRSDDFFPSTLDAAFQAIVDPKPTAEVDDLTTSGIHQASPIFDLEATMKMVDPNGTEISNIPSRGALLHSHSGVESLYSHSFAAHSHLDSMNSITHHGSGRGNAIQPEIRPSKFMDASKMQRQLLIHSTNISYPNDDPIPPGFWRQNKLH
ncbi:hypothetical protein N7466_005463 [Penicillium verhagenii]|uniref:uncharacterized protein n=1 Tax=Penicillium verhagenii TaxID=1562060 RepID=UPI002545BBEF|nr:uncharacterized protein N7466_005463 [Penicillium verhagenii]KAJ5929970.1 hypothetical protein N7466_005463 [Penicillium verhagenii]